MNPDEPKLSDAELMADLNIKSKSTLWRIRDKDPTFPRPIALTPGKRGTPRSEFEQWKANRPRIGVK